MKKEKTIAEQAIRTFGVWSQRQQAIEECAELILALSHFRRGKAKRLKVAEEVADVLIMAEQMRVDFGHEDVDRIKKAKERRLMGLISTYQGEKVECV